jgi:farnesyl diphosphate synthase
MDTFNTVHNFEAVFRDVIVPTIMKEVKGTGIAQNACEWIENVCCLLWRFPLSCTNWIQVIVHNTTGGKYNRGMAVPDTYRTLKGFLFFSKEDYKLTSVLGWCTELVRSCS